MLYLICKPVSTKAPLQTSFLNVPVAGGYRRFESASIIANPKPYRNSQLRDHRESPGFMYTTP
jgi:hypothetical protein